MANKLTFTSYRTADYGGQIGSMTVQVNPKSWTSNVAVQYEKQQTNNSIASSHEFSKIEDEKMDIEVLFDGTGVAGYTGSVLDKVKAFRQLLFYYQSDTHRPPYLKVVWGPFIFKGVCMGLKIDYKLIRNDGMPIRAVATVSLESSLSPTMQEALKNANSPDMTHIRTVRSGDTLPLMTHKIYNDATYYLRVAKFNGITNFRNLEPGSTVYFPPLVKLPV